MIESAEEFVRLRVSEQPEEYGRAAREEAPVSVWLDVIARYPDMREWVAQNKTVPTDVLSVLARDPDPRVRTMIAMKRKLPVELQQLLANDPDEGIRIRLAYNAKTERAVLEHLAHDGSTMVREAAARRLPVEPEPPAT
jgi:hypothetical protein